MRLLRFFGGYLRRYTIWLLLAAIAIPLYGLASAGMVALIEPIFGEVLLADSESPVPALPEGDGEDPTGLAERFNLKRLAEQGYAAAKRSFGITPDQVVWFTPLLFVGVFFLRGLANFVSGYSFQRVGLGVTTDVRNDLFGRLIAQSTRFHSRHDSGELVSRAINDVTVMQTAVSSRLLDLFQQGITLIFLLYLLISTAPKLALICLVGTPLVIVPIVHFGKGMRRTSHRSQARLAEVTSLLAQAVRGHRVVKAFGAERWEQRRFNASTERHMRMSLRAQILDTISSPVIENLSSFALAGFLIWAGLQIRGGEMSAPLLVQFLANLMLLYEPVRKLNKVNLILQQALAAGHRVVDLLDEPNEIVEKPEAIPAPPLGEAIRFDGVTFAYDDEPVLRGIDLDVPRGSIVALVGPSGAGKSSLVNLLPRFFDPDEGAVRFDGRDIRDFTLSSLRAQIGIVSQETVLFDDTVRGNIAYGRPDASHEDVVAAARASYAEEFIERLAHGYETRVGESGLQLSGGQRQRLAIARALLADAPILILDEATSQLDSESEALFQKALGNLVANRTTLVIAHRLSTIVSADKIVVMEHGRIVEAGTHRELLERDGLYARLYTLQFSERETG